MNARLALITFLDGPSDGRPDNSLPGHQPPVDPGYGQGHPRPPYIGGGPAYPPVYPTPGPILPPAPNPPTIDNTLPEATPPPQISLPIYLPPEINPTPPDQARKFELKYSVRYGWVLVPVGQPPVPEPK